MDRACEKRFGEIVETVSNAASVQKSILKQQKSQPVIFYEAVPAFTTKASEEEWDREVGRGTSRTGVDHKTVQPSG